MPNRTVKVAELKAKLSAYLRRASHGETITILDRETPVAELRRPAAGNAGEYEMMLQRGQIHPGAQEFSWLEGRPVLPIRVDLQRLLDDIRGDT